MTDLARRTKHREMPSMSFLPRAPDVKDSSSLRVLGRRPWTALGMATGAVSAPAPAGHSLFTQRSLTCRSSFAPGIPLRGRHQ